MKKRGAGIVNFILIVSLLAAAVHTGASHVLTVQATTANELQEEINRRQEALNELYGQISDWEAQQDMILEKIEDLNSEIINTMASIGLKEEEIAAKETEIQEKQEQITLTAAEYEEAKQQEEDQRLNMAARTRILYEQGNDSYLTAIFGGTDFTDMLNRMDYIEKVYAYSKMQLDQYIESKDQIQDLWALLEQEEAELESDKQQLESDRAALQDQKVSLDAMLAEKKKESDNYEAELDKARQQAAVAQKLLQQDKEKLQQMQAAQNAANATYATTDYTKIIDGSSGSDLGKKVAKFACQYIGNPYVSGGTSLTNGADCSGFTYRVYSNFGYNLPRTSTEQRNAGTSVNYSDAQPGDLICYEGHVAIYIGGGMVVHASNSNPYPRGGIKVNGATYRTIIAVRRII